MRNKILLISILLIAFVIRFYNLSSIPSGINYDEADQGYNAYSILNTGKDEYGMPFPIFLRSFGFYASSLYAYLSIIPISILGLTIFSTRVISAIAGVLLVFLTYLIIRKIDFKNNQVIGLIGGTVIALAPWSILFSRGAFEANLALTIFVASIYFFITSLNKKRFLIVATILLGISTYAYQSERLVSVLFLTVFLGMYWQTFNNSKKIAFLAVLAFIVVEFPQILLLDTLGSSVRFKQLSYLGLFLNKSYSSVPAINYLLIGFDVIREFLSQYVAYFSPRNLFFDPDPQGIRSIPQLSVFYPWMVIPFFIGIKYLAGKVNSSWVKIILIIIVVSPIPAAIVSDPFSVLRVLPVLWGLTIVISFGIYQIINYSQRVKVKIVIGIVLTLLSLVQLYICYFILFKYEGSKAWGYSYIELNQVINKYSNKQIVVEDKVGPAYIEYAFLSKLDPRKLQAITDPKVVSDYYNQVKFNNRIIIGNVEFRPIMWQELEEKDQIIIISPEVLSDSDAVSHKLSHLLDIKDKTDEVVFKVYQTNPKLKTIY